MEYIQSGTPDTLLFIPSSPSCQFSEELGETGEGLLFNIRGKWIRKVNHNQLYLISNSLISNYSTYWQIK